MKIYVASMNTKYESPELVMVTVDKQKAIDKINDVAKKCSKVFYLYLQEYEDGSDDGTIVYTIKGEKEIYS